MENIKKDDIKDTKYYQDTPKFDEENYRNDDV